MKFHITICCCANDCIFLSLERESMAFNRFISKFYEKFIFLPWMLWVSASYHYCGCLYLFSQVHWWGMAAGPWWKKTEGGRMNGAQTKYSILHSGHYIVKNKGLPSAFSVPGAWMLSQMFTVAWPLPIKSEHVGVCSGLLKVKWTIVGFASCLIQVSSGSRTGDFVTCMGETHRERKRGHV